MQSGLGKRQKAKRYQPEPVYPPEGDGDGLGITDPDGLRLGDGEALGQQPDELNGPTAVKAFQLLTYS